MRTSGKIKQTSLNATILIAVLFLFGTPARANVVASPTTMNFGNQALGTASTSMTVIVTNQNRRSTEINGASLSTAQFSVSGPSLPVTLSAGGSATFSVKFAPTAAQAYSGTLAFTRSNGSTTTVALSGMGIGTTPVQGPAIAMQPVSQTITGGQTATFSATATGTSPMTFQWLKNGAAISGANSSSYTTPAETTSDNNAQFAMTVSNSAGSATSNAAMLTVNAANTYVIFANPTSLSFSVQVGAAATSKSIKIDDTTPSALPFTLSADKPWITLNALSSTTAGGGVMLQFGVNAAGLAAGSYSGNVILTASGVSNSPMAVPMTLTVTPAPAVAPAITSQPSSQTITAGQTASFNVAATGTSPMTFQWMKNGAAISGATSSTYATPAETTSDNSAHFTVTVSNSAGNATSNAAILTVNAPVVAPSITSQPSNKSVFAGQTATFSVTATGTATLTYQWSKNGSAIGGATSSTYTTPAETTADNNAQFTVAVSNSTGSVTSSPATLTVGATTLILNASSTAMNFGSVTMGSNSTQNVTLTNAGNSNITISNVSVSGAGFNASGASGVILTPGQTTTLSATFAPATAGNATGSVTVASNATNSSTTIALSGTGIAPVNHSVTLSWIASTSTVMGYNTYSSSVSGGPYTKVNSSLNSGMSYTDSSVQAGKTYYYVVTAVDSTNMESVFSGEVSALVP